jgi:gliding motility-associated-like protein
MVSSLSGVFTTEEYLLTVYESMGNAVSHDEYMDQILITESDIVVSNLDAHSTVTIQIINDEFNCLDDIPLFDLQHSFEIGSNDRECLFIPSVFTPNADGINDTWQIDGIELYENPTIRVFDRWGQMIFESLDQDYVPWDGVSQISNKNQEIATYYYVINLNIDNKKYNGSVTIKR